MGLNSAGWAGRRMPMDTGLRRYDRGWGADGLRSAGASVLGVDLDEVVFGVAEEEGAVAPGGEVGWGAGDGHAFCDELGVAGVDGGGRYAEGELDRGRAGCRRAVVAGGRGAARAQGEERRADAEADPGLGIVFDGKAHHVFVEAAGPGHVAAEQDDVVAVVDVLEAHDGSCCFRGVTRGGMRNRAGRARFCHHRASTR